MAFPTNPIYKILKERAAGTDPDGNVITPQVTAIIKYLGIEGHYLEIPLNENNTDYQEYLEWAKTNTAEAAD
jgi:hypothetical protein